MGSDGYPNPTKEFVVKFPPLISSKELRGLDSIDGTDETSDQCQQNRSHSGENEGITNQRMIDVANNSNKVQSVSISMPQTPKNAKKVLFNDNPQEISSKIARQGSPSSKTTKFYSHQLPRPVTNLEGTHNPKITHYSGPQGQQYPNGERIKDARFDSFKTWSGKLERQLSNLRGRSLETCPEDGCNDRAEGDALPVDRYFDALEGPELDTLRPSEELMLPEDKKWPFLLRFPISSFGICLGVTSQAILWKTMATSKSTSFLNISPIVNMVLWTISITLAVGTAAIYALKLIFYFEAVRREYYHPIRVNYFFAPFIALLFLALGSPEKVTNELPQALWYVLMFPFLCLEVKIYGQWMSGGERRLSKVANPSNHLAVVGNFIGALLGASMGLKEGPLFFFAVGMAHYIVLFVTLYQRLPTNETLPKELHPVFFLFVAAPSVASMAWAKIQGSFDYGARISYFIALFLYCSLAVRINFFRGFRFSLAWWAYTVPMSGAATASLRYSNEVTNWVTRTMAMTLTVISTVVVTAMLVTTLLHAFVFRNLFPNDIAIAITDIPAKPTIRWLKQLRHGSSDTKDIDQYFNFSNTEGSELKVSVHPSNTTGNVIS